MKWFDGDIVSAITKCKADRSVLIVYIKGDDDASKAMDMMWEESDICDFFNNRPCIPLVLEVDSVGGQQFSQIYPVLTVPSTFYISNDGVPLEVIAGSCSVSEMLEKASSVLKPAEEKADESRLSDEVASASDTATSQVEDESGDAILNVSSTTPEDKEAKIQKARELMKKKQQEKALEEKEKARNAEIERRKLGRDVNKLKEFKAEQEAKETREALRKDKEETRIAREKIREQIRKDREARHAKYQTEKSERDEALKKKQQEKLQKDAEEAARIAAANSSNARIQFRLPDGSSINNTFGADDKLLDAQKFVALHSSNPLGSQFRLAVIYPRRVFTPADYSSSFRELDLVPTSALLVLPPASSNGEVTQSSSVSSFSSLLNILFNPILLLWRYVSGFIFGTPIAAASQSANQTGRDQKPQSGDRSGSGQQPTRRIGRLTDLPPGGDDQNTWNGNSTQQM